MEINAFSTTNIILYSISALILPYITGSFIMLWKIDRMLIVLPAMLIITALYFSLVLIKAPAPSFIMTVCIIYIYLSLSRRMLLIHLGGIILTVCVMEEAKYPESCIKLVPGDVVFLYTDGITEAMNDADEMFGKDRMLSCLNGMQDAAREEIIRRVSEDVGSFVNGAEQYDDLTMLAVKYTG